VTGLTLKLRQSAQVGDRAREDFVLGTMEYLPGSVIRGAFAAAWIARNGVSERGTSQRAEFLRLFEGGVRFGALLPEGAEDPSLSVLSHKYRPLDSCGEVEYDRATDDDVPLHCPDCGSPLEQRTSLRGDRPLVRRLTSVSIHESGVARRGALFTRESLHEQQKFTGSVTADDEALLDVLGGLGPVRVGGRRTTHGLAGVTIARQAAPPPTAQVRRDGKLILRLRSPGIFVDDQGRPRREPTEAELKGLLGVRAQVVDRWMRWQQVGGWHIASGLPKPGELAVAPGATYLISAEQPVAGSVLEELGRRGVGLRRHEGFGDLAPPPTLMKGQNARRAEERRLGELMDSVAPLRGYPARWAKTWPALLDLMARQAAGDLAATERLRRLVGAPPEPGVGAALRIFLGLPLEDARYVVEELRRL
jgi:CRISPR-associated protein Csx10